MTGHTPDLAAAGRVSRRIRLGTINLTEVIFTLEKEGSGDLKLTLCQPVVEEPKDTDGN